MIDSNSSDLNSLDYQIRGKW